MFKRMLRVGVLLIVSVVTGTAGAAVRAPVEAQDGPCYWIDGRWVCPL